ncbi:MAG: pectate lyase [Candidatus Latescibacteria bacterium]|nr:pectate lyase [Candidatus Latescibacterota bacterium]
MIKGMSKVMCMMLLIICPGVIYVKAADDSQLKTEAMEAMKKASRFYYGTVSTKGGYLFEYTVDMKHRYGELPALESQIWVQDPATPGVGQVYLDAYEATGDDFYLEAADAAARALVRGQLECGGWNYLIDFKAGSVDEWYKHAGIYTDFNEFAHFDGNATFDDRVTYGPTMLLLRLYDLTSDPVYLGPLDKALNLVLDAQYTGGGWSQRYPPVGTGYDTYYTFNDDVIQDNIDLLLNAYKILGFKKYLDAALRGADFIILSQHAGPQYGWGLQYTHDMKLAWGRIFEPPSLCSSATVRNVNTLMDIYLYTGDRRYLEPIPKALDWMDSNVMPDGSIGVFIEEGTNRAMAAMYDGDSGSYDSIKITYDMQEAMGGYGYVMNNFSTKRERDRYNTLASTTWHKPDEPSAPTGEKAQKLASSMENDIHHIIDSLDDMGRWTEDGRLYTERFYFKNEPEYTGPDLKNGWLRTQTFIRNIRTLARYIRLQNSAEKP